MVWFRFIMLIISNELSVKCCSKKRTISNVTDIYTDKVRYLSSAFEFFHWLTYAADRDACLVILPFDFNPRLQIPINATGARGYGSPNSKQIQFGQTTQLSLIEPQVFEIIRTQVIDSQLYAYMRISARQLTVVSISIEQSGSITHPSRIDITWMCLSIASGVELIAMGLLFTQLSEVGLPLISLLHIYQGGTNCNDVFITDLSGVDLTVVNYYYTPVRSRPNCNGPIYFPIVMDLFIILLSG